MNKKVFIFLGAILLLIIIVVWFIIFLRNKNAALNTGNNSALNSSNSGSNNGGTIGGGTSGNIPINKVSDTPVISPVFSYDNKAIWFFTNDGHLYKENLSSGLKQEYLLPDNLKTDNVIWPQAGNDFIVETDGTAGKTFNYYNSAKKTFTAYPSNVKEVDFMPDGAHVVYEWVDSNGSNPTLSVANSDLSGHQLIVNLTDNDDILKVSPLGNAVFAWKNKTPNDGKIHYIIADSKKIFDIKTAADNEALWSPTGHNFIFDKLGADGNKSSSQLWLGDLVSQNDKALGFSTSISKVAFDPTGKTIYYAIGGQGSQGDSFWKMDVASLTATKIWSNDQNAVSPLNASGLMISSDGATLFFKNSDGFLYQLTVPKS